MNKTVRITIEKEFEINIDDSLLTEEALEEFSEGMFGVVKPEDLFEYVARCVFNEETTHVEGLGEVVQEHLKEFSKEAQVTFKGVYYDTQVEMVDD